MSTRIRKTDPGWGRRLSSVALSLAVSISSVACASTVDSLSKSLAFASFEFNDGVRWRKYQQASRRLSPVIRDAYLDHTEKTDERVNVSEINLLRTRINVKQKTAVLRFRYIWHLASRGIVRKSVVVEHWKQIKSVWYIMKILHGSGKEEFPLFVGLTPDARKKARPRPSTSRQPVTPAARRPSDIVSPAPSGR